MTSAARLQVSVGVHWVELVVCGVLYDLTPSRAKALAGQLLSAAEEAESKPRFTDEDIRAIYNTVTCTMDGSLPRGTEDALRKLRKLRGES